MRLIGYLRSSLPDEVGKQDMEEQERSMAEYCQQRGHELVGMVCDENSGSSIERNGLNSALTSQCEGILVTDPLVITDKYSEMKRFFARLVEYKKQLLVIYENRSFDPSSAPDADRKFLEAYPQLLR